MSRNALYVSAYDLADGERERAARILEGYGIRVQRSVFELRLTHGQRERLLGALEKLGLKSGSVLLYRRDAGGKRYESGTAPQRPFEEDNHAWIIGVPGRSDPSQVSFSKTSNNSSQNRRE